MNRMRLLAMTAALVLGGQASPMVVAQPVEPDPAPPGKKARFTRQPRRPQYEKPKSESLKKLLRK